MLTGLASIRSAVHTSSRLGAAAVRSISRTPEERSGSNQEASQSSDKPIRPPTKHIDRSKVPELDEADILEKHVGGSGPGGQSVNKSVNACQIKHLPTGIVVKVHQSRSLEMNRKIAREILQTKLDNLVNGENSVEAQKRRLALHRQAIRESQSERRRLLKEQFRERVAPISDLESENDGEKL